MRNDFMSTQFSTPERAPYNRDEVNSGSLISKPPFATLVSRAMHVIERHLSVPANHTAAPSEILKLQSGLERER